MARSGRQVDLIPVCVRLTETELSELDFFAGPMSRSDWLRVLIRGRLLQLKQDHLYPAANGQARDFVGTPVEHLPPRGSPLPGSKPSGRPPRRASPKTLVAEADAVPSTLKQPQFLPVPLNTALPPPAPVLVPSGPHVHAYGTPTARKTVDGLVLRRYACADPTCDWVSTWQ
jgi:hypothetical protein